MSFRALNHSVNILGYKKNNVNYVMACAWAMMVDYDKILCLLGEQSVTGKNIKKGDKIGFSCLAKNQKNIAIKLGDNHSDEIDKLEGVDYSIKDGCIIINNSCTMCVCEVIDILHLEEIENDNLLYLRVLSYEQGINDFLSMGDF